MKTSFLQTAAGW